MPRTGPIGYRLSASRRPGAAPREGRRHESRFQSRAADLETWRALAREDLRGKDPETLERETPEGLRIKPLYTAADLEGLEGIDSLPGAGAVPARPARDHVRESPVDDPAVRRATRPPRSRMRSTGAISRPGRRGSPSRSISPRTAATTRITRA